MLVRLLDLTLPVGRVIDGLSRRQFNFVCLVIAVLFIFNFGSCLHNLDGWMRVEGDVEPSRIEESVSNPDTQFLGVVVEPLKFVIGDYPKTVTQKIEITDGVLVGFVATHVLSYRDDQGSLRYMGFPSDGEEGDMQFAGDFIPRIGDEVWMWRQVQRGRVVFLLGPTLASIEKHAEAMTPIKYDTEVLTAESLLAEQYWTNTRWHFYATIVVIVVAVLTVMMGVHADAVDKRIAKESMVVEAEDE